MRFTDLGIPVDAVESRTAAICTSSVGDCRIVIAAKGFLLVVDPVTEHCTQIPFPNEHDEYPYDTFSSSAGIFYIGAGAMFYAFDPFKLAYIESIILKDPEELCGFSYAENADGHIYVASYPSCRLYRYRPAQRDWTCFGSMDAEQKYPFHMAIDAWGWIYLGLGTTKKNVIAFHPLTNEKQELLQESQRTIGIGQVRQGPSRQVYALLGEHWAHMEQGAVIAELGEKEPDSYYTGSSFGKFHRQLPGDWKMMSHSLSDYALIVRHERNGQEKTIKLRYQSKGASLSPIIVGPDQKLYGTSNHPMHFYSFDPKSNKLINWGSKVIQNGSGGNIAAYAVQGSILAGASYPNGRLHLYDTAKPMQWENSDNRNPIEVAAYVDVHRPRCALSLHDGEHVVYGGFPGYGMVGGGLAVYSLQAGTAKLIPHNELIPQQSTLSLAEASDGTLIGGTSIETPGGAEPAAKSAFVYKLDWQRRTILKRWQLDEQIREYSLLLIDPCGRIHTLTSCSNYYVWDPEQEIIIYHADLSAWGTIVRAGWQFSEADQCIYGVLSQAVFAIPLESLQPKLLAVPPHEITAGFALLQQKLYFACSTHLWSYSLIKG